ncbi:MAG: hypothetical protein GQ527_08465 [Bacteroidales bacterium]|nr:hypothetical protein [Bacteroidales bacterium]
MKNTTRYLLTMSLLLFWSSLSADGVIKNGATLKLKKGSHLIEKGSLFIQGNAHFIIEGMATIDGSISNNSGFKGVQITSDADNTGSLIYNGGSPKAEVQRYMTTRGNHIIGSPVSGTTAETLDFYGNPYTSLRLYTDGAGLSLVSNDELLIQGQGYYYSIGSSPYAGITPVFKGNLSSEDLELDNSTIPAIQFNYKGLNMVANPYSSAIDWDDENITTSNMEKSVWVYNSRTRRYLYRNQSGYGNLKDGIIPMGQGFYVRAKNSNASLTIPKEARRHEDQAFYKSDESVNDELNYLSLEVRKDTLSDEIWVGYQWDSSDEFDDGIDISKVFTFEDEPQIYGAHNNQELCVDVVEEPDNNGKTVPINFRVGNSGIHQLALLTYQGFNNVTVQLEDLVTGELQEVIDMNTYEFEATVGDAEERFLLHFNPFNTVNTEDIYNTSQVHIYAYQNTIYINSDGKYADQSKNILIYDVNGKQLGEVFLPAGKMQKIENIYQRKVLIIKAIYPQEIFTRKILNF